MKTIFSRKSLRVYIALLFLAGIGLAVFLHQYNQNDGVNHPESVVPSDTIIGDISRQEADSIGPLNQ